MAYEIQEGVHASGTPVFRTKNKSGDWKVFRSKEEAQKFIETIKPKPKSFNPKTGVYKSFDTEEDRSQYISSNTTSDKPFEALNESTGKYLRFKTEADRDRFLVRQGTKNAPKKTKEEKLADEKEEQRLKDERDPIGHITRLRKEQEEIVDLSKGTGGISRDEMNKLRAIKQAEIDSVYNASNFFKLVNNFNQAVNKASGANTTTTPPPVTPPPVKGAKIIPASEVMKSLSQKERKIVRRKARQIQLSEPGLSGAERLEKALIESGYM